MSRPLSTPPNVSGAASSAFHGEPVSAARARPQIFILVASASASRVTLLDFPSLRPPRSSFEAGAGAAHA